MDNIYIVRDNSYITCLNTSKPAMLVPSMCDDIEKGNIGYTKIGNPFIATFNGLNAIYAHELQLVRSVKTRYVYSVLNEALIPLEHSLSCDYDTSLDFYD